MIVKDLRAYVVTKVLSGEKGIEVVVVCGRWEGGERGMRQWHLGQLGLGEEVKKIEGLQMHLNQ
jgi:hypothetical protein